jgi:hypothetical protein
MAPALTFDRPQCNVANQVALDKQGKQNHRDDLRHSWTTFGPTECPYRSQNWLPQWRVPAPASGPRSSEKSSYCHPSEGERRPISIIIKAITIDVPAGAATIQLSRSKRVSALSGARVSTVHSSWLVASTTQTCLATINYGEAKGSGRDSVFTAILASSY